MKVKCNNCGKEFEQNDFAAQSASILGLPSVCGNCSPTESGSKSASKCAYVTLHIDLDPDKWFSDLEAELENLELQSGDIVDIHIEDRDDLEVDK